MHVDVSRAYFHAKAQRPVLVNLPAGDCSGRDEGKIGLLKKSMYGTRDAASNWASRKLGLWAGAQFKKLVPWQEKENFGLDKRRRLYGDRNEGELVGAQDVRGVT